MNNKYFKEALIRYMSDISYGDAVRKLADQGMNIDEIMDNISSDVSRSKVQKYLDEYNVKKQNGDLEYEYVERINEYGRKSFIKVKKDRT